MNNKLKNSKGITLISLMVTIIALLIVSNITIYSVKDSLGIGRLKDMQNDIENLNDKISAYYNQYGTLPIINEEYTNITEIKDAGLISETVDKGKFYIIDLSALENLTLTYGKDFKNVNNTSDKNTLKDIYIINETSHNIFYVKGIKLDDKMFYTNYMEDQVDKEAVDIKYVDNIKIPEGYTYIGKTDQNEIQIKDNQENIYTWTNVNEIITSVPTGIIVNAKETEAFINSVNAYKGYYKKDSSVVYIPLDEKWTTKVDEEFKYKDKTGKTVIIPKGFCVSQVKGEDEISKGLVIKNNETDDRYVWVEVPKTIYDTAQSEKDYENIEKDMQEYASEYRDGSSIDNWYNGCGISNSTEYVNLKNKMLESVYEKGGFWISQYEIGVDTIATSTGTSRTPRSKADMYPYTYVTCAQAQQLSTNMKSNDLTSSLLFGIQWDLTLKFIEENNGKTKSLIKEDSTTWGNYQNATFTIYKGSYSVDDGKNYTAVSQKYTKTNVISDTTDSNVLITTGATIRNCALNIYDLAGNVFEFTLEQTTDGSNPCTIRGGYSGISGSVFSAYSRQSKDRSGSYENCGFRTTLY